jgi:hypothetical protein
MAGADAVLKGALGRSRSGSSFGGSRGTRTATVRQSNKDRAHGLATASAPNTHLMSGGSSGIPQFPNNTNQGRNFRTFK